MKACLLVVEDDPNVAAEVVRGLGAAGFEVELATNGRAGLASVMKTPPDLVVLDLMLPERSGFEVLQDLRGRVGVPIIVLTARTSKTRGTRPWIGCIIRAFCTGGPPSVTISMVVVLPSRQSALIVTHLISIAQRKSPIEIASTPRP